MLSEVLLVNSYKKKQKFEDQVKYSKKGTHRIGKPQDFGVILYNVQAIENIHPVQDEYLFSQMRAPNQIKKYSFSKKLPEEAKIQIKHGFANSDDIYFYYKAYNGVVGYITYCYAYESKNNEGMIFLIF